MSVGVGDYLVIGAVAAATTAVATPVVLRVAEHRRWVVAPNTRSVHTIAIPHVGGVAMLVGFLAAFGTAWATGTFSVIFDDNSEPPGVLIAVLIVFATGFLDDIKDMAPPGKVTGVVLAGIALTYFGATMFYFRFPFLDVVLLSGDWQGVVTVLWLLGMTQAINLIDGLDGLAAGIVAIASAAFFVYAYKLGEPGLELVSDRNPGPLIAIITTGVCVGFLPYNFNPARIFMGDCGAFLLGTLLAVSTSLVGGRADPATQDYVGQTFFFFAPLAIPLLILGVPILDTLFAIVRRLSKRQPFDVADKGHLHHRLMNLGHGHRRAVLILWAWTALLSGFVLYPVLTDRNPSYLPFGIGALGIVLFTVLHPSVRRKQALAVEAALDRPASEQIDPSRPERREAERLTRHGGSAPEQVSSDVEQAVAVVDAAAPATPAGELRSAQRHSPRSGRHRRREPAPAPAHEKSERDAPPELLDGGTVD
jgi:UDP-GlcNAc:undecaprenyl-phosphate GlcNAc-1-phosphate transferase